MDQGVMGGEDMHRVHREEKRKKWEGDRGRARGRGRREGWNEMQQRWVLSAWEVTTP